MMTIKTTLGEPLARFACQFRPSSGLRPRPLPLLIQSLTPIRIKSWFTKCAVASSNNQSKRITVKTT